MALEIGVGSVKEENIVSDDQKQSAPSPAEVITTLIFGQYRARILYTLAHFGIADLLANGPRTVEELAEATATHAPALYRVLRAAAGDGMVAEQPDGRFALTPVSDYLRDDHPGGLRYMSLLANDEWLWRSWEGVLHTVKTGEPAFEYVFQMDRFAYLEQHPRSRQIFDRAMHGYSEISNAGILASYDFSTARRVIDLGGGNGSLLLAILRAHPDVEGALLELPAAIEQARPLVEASGMADRCMLMVGDFIHDVPTGYDVYLVQRCFHNWDDENVVKALQHIHSGIASEGRLLIIEMVLPPGNTPSIGKLLDVDMMLTTHGGRERTEAEWRVLLEQCGFVLQNTLPVLYSPLAILECRAVR